jgi:hypothetical protein
LQCRLGAWQYKFANQSGEQDSVHRFGLQTYIARREPVCNYFFLPLYSSETVNLARPFARRAANTRRPFFVAILSRKPCLFFLFLLEGWNVLFIVLYILYCLYSLFRLCAFQLAKLLFFFKSAKFSQGIFLNFCTCLAVMLFFVKKNCHK